MVKFSFIALAGALAAASAGPYPSRRTIKLGDRRLRRGEPGTEALIKRARPYRKHAAANAVAGKNARHRRRLEGDFEIDGTYNFKFSQCVDVKVQDEDLFDEDIVEYVQAGQIVAAKSYVLFHVCQEEDCYYEAEEDLYIVDLPTYLANIATYHANKRSDYCEQCDEFEDVCNVEDEDEEDEDGDGDDEDGEDADEGEDGEAEEEDGEDQDEGDAGEEEGEEEDNQEEGQEQEEDKEQEDEQGDENQGEENQDQEGQEGDEGQDRQLKKVRRKNNQRKFVNKERKATERALGNKMYIDCDQCVDYECYVDYDEMDDGVQRRDELDQEVSEWIADLAECKESGQQWNGQDLYLGAMCSPYGDGVELAVFMNDDCTMYTNQKSFMDVWDPYNDNDDGINYLTYAEYFIKNAFSEVTSCLDPDYNDPNDADDDNADEGEDMEYEVNDYCDEVFNGDAIAFNNNCAAGNNQNDEDDDEYAWYTYDLREADDIEEVCYALNLLEGEYSYVYDEEASGTWYERNRNGEIANAESSEGALSGGIIAIIVGVSLIVVAGAIFLMKPKKKSSDSNEPVYQGGTML